MNQFKGKVALVTGASRSIGKAIAEAFAREGADIAMIYASNDEAAAQAAAGVRALGVRAESYRLDVSDAEAAEQTVSKVLADFGRIDILVNNAGITRDRLLLQMKEEEFDRVLDVNLKGCYHMIRFTARQFLKNRSGRIINISSVAGLMGNVGQANYAAAKAGMIGLTKTVAKEFASRGITCNAIAPGFIETDMTAAMSEEARDAITRSIPMGRAGRPEDIAQAAVFLASESASYVTGEVIKVDGGLYI